MTSLELAEAVPLGYAMVSRVARDAGVRALAIKGPVPAALGLANRHRTTLDIDVLVEPDREAVRRFMGALGQLGWTERVVNTAAQVLPLHSTSLSHVAWPCEIDVHDRFPGFLEDRSVVFNVLWERHAEVAIGGQRIACTDYESSAVIACLHYLRDGERRIDDVRRLSDAIAARLGRGHRNGLPDLARATGATQTLTPLWELLGIEVSVDAVPDIEAYGAWLVRVDGAGTRAVPAFYELSRSPLRRWPRLIWRSLWLTEAEIREKQPGAGPGKVGLMLARIRRLGWGLQSAPRALRVVIRSRTSRTRTEAQ